MAYNKRFFARRVAKYDKPERELAQVLYTLFEPRTVYDVGCGIGSYISEFRRLGATVGGCDKYANTARPYIPENVRDLVTAWDAGRTMFAPAQADMVLCIEVAEHVTKANSWALVDNLVRCTSPGGRIIFTAAGPGQPGHGHVNLRPPAYWGNIFGGLCTVFDVPDYNRTREALICMGDPLKLAKNLHVYRRPE